MNNCVYKLKEDVSISEFSGVGNDEYLIVYHNRQWKVSKIVYTIILELDSDKEKENILDDINQKFDVKIGDIDKVERFLKDNSLIVGTEDAPEMSKNIGQKNIWGRITLISPRIIKKLFFLSYAYNVVFISLMSLIGVASVIFVLVSNPPANMGRLLFSLRIDKLILCTCLAVFIGVFHELGHSAALMRYRGEPKRIGAAVYLFMPVFFSDVTAAWQLKKNQRIVVDLGGLYFQSMIIAVLNFINIWANSIIIKYAILISATTFFSNLVPFFKLDGYWVVCDYLGVTNMWKAIAEHLRYKFKKSEKKSEISFLSVKKKLVFYCFIMFSCLYVVYYGAFFWSTLEYTVKAFYNDVQYLMSNRTEIYNSLGLYSVIKYIVSRFTMFIFAIFILKKLYKLIKLIILKIIKRRAISCDS